MVATTLGRVASFHLGVGGRKSLYGCKRTRRELCATEKADKKEQTLTLALSSLPLHILQGAARQKYNDLERRLSAPSVRTAYDDTPALTREASAADLGPHDSSSPPLAAGRDLPSSSLPSPSGLPTDDDPSSDKHDE